ncbi:Isoamylase 1, chloroplastic [Vitis vinifera]|uniref:Isoamylase 1, chloroplastic n=1 Tax=Vitis vinifera TaxID=29760 RepID=A0A438GT06_VITVI|nr:Isoamylase 1, chloroplastic [Vitis vinifera]
MLPASVRETLLGWDGSFVGKKRREVWRVGPLCIFWTVWKFDWEGDLPLKYPQKDLIIYEMHVRGFTRHESSRTKFPGTYHGVVEKLDHLKVASSEKANWIVGYKEVKIQTACILGWNWCKGHMAMLLWFWRTSSVFIFSAIEVELGVNCIELMPCHEFNELEYFSYNSVLDDYSPPSKVRAFAWRSSETIDHLLHPPITLGLWHRIFTQVGME